MNSKHTPIRVFGQRLIPSSFRSLPSNLSDDSKRNVGNVASGEGTRISLSDFLNRKLQKSSGLSGRVPGKSTPFLSPLGLRTSTDGHDAGSVKQTEEETKNVNDKMILQRFKHTDEENHDSPSSINEVENSVVDDIQESKKRKDPFEGENERHAVRKKVVVLGGEPKPRQKERTESCKEKPKQPLYNHYKNGRGWWDYDMEGVDNEEVGFTEIWEGVGSASLGGIVDWH
ncbi:hypothetical protein L6164_016631 [Bauhinia variegata]|uniref:Uncharacterized protein n=1 Tax=Bauhinia variegata TaxID=167791 RepID=A0ACB9NSA6_BAUVA|nr:hypothetical protein L6164_016631 [Bauhinia variegata]